MENLERVLIQHPFFQGLKRDHLQTLVGCAANTRFEKGSFVFHAGEEANEFYLIREGKIALEAPPGRKAVTIAELAGGDVLGWSWLVPPYRWRFDARVEEATRAIKLNGKCLREKWESDHDLGFELLKRFTVISEQRMDAVQRAFAMISDAA